MILWPSKAHRIDYQKRIFVWFVHYLNVAPAGRWITEGQRYLQRQAEIQDNIMKKQLFKA